MAVVENQFPFKIYEAVNAGSGGANVFLGKASIAGVNGNKESFFPELAEANCFTTFVFASIVGGKNVRVTPATEDDPYIYVDSRFYCFEPCADPATSVLADVQYGGTGDVTVFMKSLVSDGSIIIQGGDCQISLSTHKYYSQNICQNAGVYSSTVGVPGASDVTFLFKSVLGGDCISVVDTGETLVVNYDLAACNPCLFCGEEFEPKPGQCNQDCE